jgi:hypothetical protein
MEKTAAARPQPTMTLQTHGSGMRYLNFGRFEVALFLEARSRDSAICALFVPAKPVVNRSFTPPLPQPTLLFVSTTRVPGVRLVRACTFAAQFLLFSCLALAATLQKPPAKSETQPVPQLPAQIELLETKYRFETNGDSRKEVYARVKINNELGVQQFARLKFNFNRSFQSVEIPLVRIIHPSGGTAEILPSAITDDPDPAVVDFPAYQDVRVKSVRILGLGPGDLLEYRVITTTTHPPLAPDFWLEHSFDHSGVVSEEIFELDLPSLTNLHVQINPAFPPENLAAAKPGRKIYRWTRKQTVSPETSNEAAQSKPDIVISTFSSWNQLASRLSTLLIPDEQESHALYKKAASLVGMNDNVEKKIAAIYDFVSQKIRTVDLPLGATGYRPQAPDKTLADGYGTAEDKFVLFAALGNNFFGPARAGFVSGSNPIGPVDLPSPQRFDHLLTMTGYPSINFWLDLNVEVAPFAVIPTQFRDEPVFVVGPAVQDHWETVKAPLPFPSSQKVEVHAALDIQGTLDARVTYVLRGDNELLLRVAFHRNPKDKWKDLAQLLALSDGFRGHVTSVEASDPYATSEPFHVEYEVTQPKFVNWAKKPVRIPAILPLVGLPDPPSPSSTAPVDLGTPLDIDLECTLKLPPGTSARVPTGTSVTRDYAEFSSNYSAARDTLTATRHIRFLRRVLPSGSAADYNAFVHAVQSDEAQDFTLERPAAPPPNAHQPSAAQKP